MLISYNLMQLKSLFFKLIEVTLKALSKIKINQCVAF